MLHVCGMPYNTSKSKWWKSNPDSTMPKRYTSISLPTGLITEIEKLFEELEKNGIDLGYASMSEYTKDALRRLNEHIRESHLQKST